MAEPSADRNMLFGILALQMDFINRDQLVAAMQGWVCDKSKSLGQILRSQGALAEDTFTLLDALANKHLAMHGNDAEKSLATLGSVSSIRRDLEHVTDADVQASLVHVGAGQKSAADPYATVVSTAGSSVGSSSSVSLGGSMAGGVRFRVLRPHARGGLGEVHVARDAELPREAALKQIQDRHADDPGSKARFLLEAEITGGLEHPGIVPVYGLGTYADGRPFYAMRFIRGDSLKEAIERFHKVESGEGGSAERGAPSAPGTGAARSALSAERNLAFRDLLRRFVDVCNAIAYAHSRGVLHRDLKPGNIMLGKYGETLVVDWGLAKVLGTPAHPAGAAEASLTTSGSSSAETVAGSAIGTPQYMSPEQAAGKIEELGAASDVYSLGATLYCLLTGRAPVIDRDVGVVLQKVQRGEFPRPRELDKSVAAPLEAICLKAMALNRTDRYSSVSNLADDIEHWLADEPVSAWPEPWTVKARRWIGRHRPLVAGVATAIVVATVGLLVATVLLKAARDREHEARELAEKNFKLARTAVDRYHTDVSESVLLKEPGMQPLRKKLLEAAREFYEKFVSERGKDPGVKAELGKAIFRLAQIIGDIGSETQAVKLHEQAAELLEKLVSSGEGDDFKVDLATCYHHLGRLYRLTDQFDKSEQAYEKAVKAWQQLLHDDPKADRYVAGLARSQNGLGNLYQLTRRMDKATDLYQKALVQRRELATANPEVEEYQRDVAVSLNNLAMVCLSMGKKDKEAQRAWEQAELIQKKLADDKPTISQYQNDLAKSNFNLGDLYTQLGKSEPAVAAYEQAAEIWAALSHLHPAVNDFQINRAEAYAALADVLRDSGNLPKAEEASRQALKVKHKLAMSHKDTPSYRGDLARGYIALGDVLRSAKKSDEAEEAYNEAIKIQENLAVEQPLTPHYQGELARGYTHLGLLYEDAKNEGKAAALYNRAIALWQKLIKEHPGDVEFASGLAQTCLNLGNLAAAHGHLAQALPWYERALANASQRDKPFFRLQRVLPLAKAGKYREAAAEADLLSSMTPPGDALFVLACTYAASATTANADDKLADAERRRLADQYADRAMKLLNAAADAGFFKTQANIQRLTSDPDLEVLRTRAEFKTFVASTRMTNSSFRTLPSLSPFLPRSSTRSGRETTRPDSASQFLAPNRAQPGR